MKNKFKIFVVAELALFFMFAGNVESKSWPRFMRSKNRTGYIQEQASPPLTLVWSYNMFSPFSMCSPVVKDGIVYVGNNVGYIYAFDCNSVGTGDVKWKNDLAGSIDSTPAIEEGSIYVFSQDSDDAQACSYNALTGAVNWKINLKGENISSPLVVDGYVYIGRGSPYRDIKGIDIDDGDIEYSFETGQPVWSSPVFYKDFIYTGSNDGSLYKLDKQLSKIWKYNTITGMFKISTVAADEDRLFLAPGLSLRRVYAIETDVSLDWQSVELNLGGSGVKTSSVGVDDDSVYVVMASTIQVIYCLNKSNKNLRWSVELGTSSGIEPYTSSPAVTYDTVYAGSETGYLTCISTYGVVISSVSLSSIISSPAVSNGYVYVVTKSGWIYAYKASRITCISSPDDEDVVDGIVTVKGSVVNPEFQSYTLRFGTGTNPSYWHFISSSIVKVEDNTLGLWNVSGFLDGVYTLKLNVNSTSFLGEARNYVIINNPPVEPTTVQASARPFGTIRITWVKSADDGEGNNDVAGYKILRCKEGESFNIINTVSAGIETYTDESVKTGLKYYYVLRSFDSRNDSVNSVQASTVTYKITVTINANNGGSVELSDGTGVYFPPSALKQDSEVAVTIIPKALIPCAGVEDGSFWNPTDKAWEFEIEPDISFNKNVTVKLCYEESDISGMDEENLRIYWYDESRKIWRIVDTSVPFPNQNQVHAYVPHFTIYRIAQYMPPEYIISKNSAYVYPNPAAGNEVTFKFKLMKAAQIDLKIFNVAGELIKEFSEIYETEDAGKTQKIKWNIQSIASGVYIWYLKAESEAREDQVIKKLGIVK